MVTEVIAAPIGDVRAASTAAGGTALTTTAGFIVLPPGSVWCSATPRNFVTAVVAKVAFNPWLHVLKTTDTLATVAAFTDASEAVQDGGALSTTTLVMNSFSTAAAGNFLYVGAHLPFRGVSVTIGNTNSNASVMTVKYWQSATPNAWTSITATDGTANAGASFGQNGNVTWTVPTDWLRRSLIQINDDLIDPNRSGGALTAELTIGRSTIPDILALPLFWTRWQFSLAFDATVTATEMYAMNRNTAQYGELLSGQTLEQRIRRGQGGIGCIEALTDAGTGNLIVNVAAGAGGFAA